MGDATFTFRVDESLKEQFATAAKGRDRSGAQLLRDFMREFVQQQDPAAYNAWFAQAVQAGRDSAHAGSSLLMPMSRSDLRPVAQPPAAASMRQSNAAGLDARVR